MRIKRSIATAVLILLSTIAYSASNTSNHTYDAPYEKVWTACVQAASEKFVITHSDKESGILSFKQGASLMSNSYGTDLTASLVKVSDTQTEVVIHGQTEKIQLMSNVGHISKKFFEAVDAKLN